MQTLVFNIKFLQTGKFPTNSFDGLFAKGETKRQKLAYFRKKASFGVLFENKKGEMKSKKIWMHTFQPIPQCTPPPKSMCFG